MTEIEMTKAKRRNKQVSIIRICDFEFVSDFEIWISSFDKSFGIAESRTVI